VTEILIQRGNEWMWVHLIVAREFHIRMNLLDRGLLERGKPSNEDLSGIFRLVIPMQKFDMSRNYLLGVLILAGEFLRSSL